jgi:NTE family protein
VQIGNAFLVDGGLYNNVPAGITRQMGADIVIALDVAQHFPHDEDIPDGKGPHPLPGPLPDFLEDFYQAIMILSDLLTNIQLEADPPDFLLRPTLGDDISLFAFHRAAEIIAAGEQAAQARLPDILKRLR